VSRTWSDPKTQKIHINFYLWTVDHGRNEGEPRTFYLPIFGGGNPWGPP
jgi:hypothetical protein